jgi:hypothetical protein
MRTSKPAVLALLVALAVLGAWRATCVLAGPDVDTDAYAHHMIARAILADPRDLGVHWVWLPLFHYIQVPLVALGGTMETVRWTNVALAAALPVVLFAYVRRSTRDTEVVPADATALLAALFAGACPIAMQMGTTAQPEPLFALDILAGAIAFQRRRYGAAALLFGAGAVLRYEAWAAVAVIALVLVLERLRPWWRAESRGNAIGSEMPRGGTADRGVAPADHEAWSAWSVVAVPAALVLTWAVLRRPVDGRWFGFLRDTRQFASSAMREQSALDGGALRLIHDALYYPLFVPWRVMGPALPLVPFGVVKTVRDQGARFVAVLAACLGFISLTWVMRSSLGLDRHFVVVVPLYATFAAQGAAVVATGAARIARWTPRWRPAAVGRSVAAVLSLAAFGGLFVVLQTWMGFWMGAIERGWPQREQFGAYLRTLPSTPTIFCDEATVEILSGLDRRRFDRHWTDDAHTWDLVAAAARARGVAYVATWADKLRGHETVGDVIFRLRDREADPSSELAVMRVTPDEGRAAR